jgi:hypothetical protein
MSRVKPRIFDRRSNREAVGSGCPAVLPFGPARVRCLLDYFAVHKRIQSGASWARSQH